MYVLELSNLARPSDAAPLQRGEARRALLRLLREKPRRVVSGLET